MSATATSPIDVVLERLGDRVKPAGAGQWMACCPAHHDRNPSLSVKVAADGRVLICCQAGCPAQAVIAAMGLQMSDLFPPKSNGNGHHNGNGHANGKPKKLYMTFEAALAAGEYMTKGRRGLIHPYRHADGAEYARVVRFDISGTDKQHLPFKKVPGGWMITDPDQWLPYRLPELADGEPIYIPEGEKACDAAASIGLTATTSAHGSKSASRTDWRALAGRNVVILPDNDEPGERYAADVALILAKLDPPAVAKIVRLPGLPPHGDMVQFIAAGGTAEQVEELANAAPLWKPEDVPAQESEIESLKPVPAGRFVQENPTEEPYQVEGVWRRQEVVTVVASSKTYKSFLALLIALCVCAARSLFGIFPTHRARVLLIDNELHPGTITNRLTKVASALGILRDEWAESIDIVSLRGRLRDIYQLAAFLRKIDRGRYGLIIIDALYRTYSKGFDENSNADMTWLFNELDEIARATGATVLVVHHSSKGIQAQKSVTDTGSGAGALSRAADAHIVLRPHEEEECAVMEAALRSSAPLKPLGLRWKYPCWTSDQNLDTTQLRQQQKRTAKPAKATPEVVQAPEFTLDNLRRCVADEPHTADWVFEAAKGLGFKNRSEVVRVLKVAVENGDIYLWPDEDRKAPHRYTSREPSLTDLAKAHAANLMTSDQAKKLMKQLAGLFSGQITDAQRPVLLRALRRLKTGTAENLITAYHQTHERIDIREFVATCEAAGSVGVTS